MPLYPEICTDITMKQLYPRGPGGTDLYDVGEKQNAEPDWLRNSRSNSRSQKKKKNKIK